MKRNLAIAFVIMIVLTGLLFRLLNRFLDTPAHRGSLVHGIQTATGGHVLIQRLGLSLIPAFGIKAYGIELTDCTMLGKGSRLTAEALELAVDPVALLGGSILVEKMTVESLVLEFSPGSSAEEAPQVRIDRAQNEHPAWKEEPLEPDRQTTPPTPNQLSQFTPFELSWAGFRSKTLEVTHGTVLLAKRGKQPTTLLKNVQLLTGEFSYGESVPFELQGEFQGTSVSAEGSVGPFDAPSVQIAHCPFVMRLKADSVSSRRLLHALNISQGSPDGIEISKVDFDLTRSADSAPILIKGGWHLVLPRILPGVRFLGRSLSTYDTRTKLLELTELSIRTEASPGRLNVRGHVAFLDDLPEFDLHLSVPPFRPGDILAEAGLLDRQELERSDVFKVAQMDARIFGTPRLFQARGASCRIDRTTAQLSFKYQASAPPSLDFDIHLNELDLDRYSKPAWSKPVAHNDEAPAGSSLRAHASEPRDWGIHGLMLTRGRLSMERGKIEGVRFTELSAAIRGEEGVIHIKPVTARLYEGACDGGASIDLRGEVPFFALQNTVGGVQAGPLTRDLTGQEQMHGSVDLGYSLRSRGSSFSDIQRSLSGKAWFRMDGGTLLGPSPLAVVRLVESVVRGSDSSQREEVPFSGLEGTFHIHKGRFYSEDFQLEGPVLRVSGQGSFGLNQTVDVKIKPTFLFPDLDDPSSALREGLSLPLRIYGTFRDASIRPDMEELDFRSVVQTLRRFLGRVNN